MAAELRFHSVGWEYVQKGRKVINLSTPAGQMRIAPLSRKDLLQILRQTVQMLELDLRRDD